MSFSSDDALIANQIPQTINLPDMDDKKNFSASIEQLLKSIADTLNSKEAGLHSLQEKCSGAMFYGKQNEEQLRDVYRKVFDLVKFNNGSVEGNGSGRETVQFSHEITNLCESAGIVAHCTSVDGLFFTVVFPDVRLNRTSIIFTNPHTEALTQCDVVANYLKR